MDRLSLLRKEMQHNHWENFLVTRLSNIRYLCGYSGSAGFLMVGARKARFFSDFRYQEQAAQQVQNAEVIIYKDDLMSELRRRAYSLNGKTAIEAPFLDVFTFQQLKQLFSAAKWVPTTKIVEQIASIKEAEEIKKIRKAVAITDAVFAEVLKLVKPGVSELDLSAEITYLHKKKGADGDSFVPIVASGPRSALPHGIASERKIRSGDLVTLDLGCFYQGYASDMTRTVVVSKASARVKELYALVQTAQNAALAAARAGMTVKELDEVARKIIRDAGHGDHFGHGLGHGLGLEIHTEPRVSFQFDDILKSGQVVTIEPGVYVPGFGGVRIEDDVIIKDGKAEVLNQSPKELLIV